MEIIEIVAWIGLVLWFALWWARFFFQRGEARWEGDLKQKWEALVNIKTKEVVSAKKSKIGIKKYRVSINKVNGPTSSFAGDYEIEMRVNADEQSLKANLGRGLLFFCVIFGLDYLFFHVVEISLKWMLSYHAVVSFLFSWVVYWQIFYVKGSSIRFRRPIIKSIPIGSIFIIWLVLDACRYYSFSDFSTWVTLLDVPGVVKAALLRVPVWVFAVLGGLYVKLRNMYLRHCEVVGIVEDPQFTYWLLATPVATAWVITLIWSGTI